jgi:ethanolamine kinase
MSTEIYEKYIKEEEKDIMKIESRPKKITYPDLYDIKETEKIPKVFVVILTDTNENFVKGLTYILKKLVPEFKNASQSDISFVHFTEGITNKIVCATNMQNNFRVNIRTFGFYTEYIIDRDMELLIMNSVPKLKVYGTFLNGIVYTYIPGRTLCIGDLIDLNTFNKTAISIAKHHKLNPPSIKKVPILFITLRKWISNVPLEYLDPKKKPYDIKKLKEELIFMEENLKNKSDVVLCHNDLLLKNFIKSETDVEVIDYEYSGYNYRAFDLVNHFNEWCGFDLNWDNFPNEDTQRRFLKIYFETYYESKKEEIDINEKINGMLEDIKWFDLASNYYWGVWALIQAALSIIDFNYNEYANLRFKRYFFIKNRLLGK